MSRITLPAAVAGCAFAVALAIGTSEAATVASVTPHVFEGGITLVDLADENLDPWGFYDGTKGVPVSGSEAATPVAGLGPVPGGWIAAAGWGGQDRDGGPDVPLFAPLPVPAGSPGPRVSSPCFWGDDRFGSVGSRNRCGHPVAQANGGGPLPALSALPAPAIILPGGSGAGNADPADREPPVPVPLPATAWLLAGALFALFRVRER